MPDVSISRFEGFSELYDDARPKPPYRIVEIAKSYYCNNIIGKVVDLGSGTGLSTEIWKKASKEVIGIEPNTDMINKAKMKDPSIKYIKGTSYETLQEDESVDIVTCSQAFHWMEPKSTINEVTRILKKGGVFIIYDCIWPVIWDYQGEKAYQELFKKVKELSKKYSIEGTQESKKIDHFTKLHNSGRFEFIRKIVFDNEEICGNERFVNIALSQGVIQDLLKRSSKDIAILIDEFKEQCMTIQANKMRVCYEVYIAIK